MLNKTERLERPGEIKADMGLQFTMEEASGSDVLEVSGISKSFGSLKLFENLSFELKRGEHAALTVCSSYYRGAEAQISEFAYGLLEAFVVPGDFQAVLFEQILVNEHPVGAGYDG